MQSTSFECNFVSVLLDTILMPSFGSSLIPFHCNASATILPHARQLAISTRGTHDVIPNVICDYLLVAKRERRRPSVTAEVAGTGAQGCFLWYALLWSIARTDGGKQSFPN